MEALSYSKIKLIARIVDIKGYCRAGHKVGEEFDVSLYEGGEWRSEERKSARTPNMCCHLYYALFPYIAVLQYDGELPWLKDKDVFSMNCPDPENCVKVEIRRIRIP